MDAGLAVFRRQYLQCLEPDFLAWPDPLLLKEADVQRWLYEQLFDTDRISRLPPERYQFRVLKPLVTKIERSIRDPEEDDISDDLMTRLSTLIASNLPTESAAVQQKTYVTFTCLREGESSQSESNDEPTITLLERRYLISGSNTTGFRTWEAALHLGSYLLTEEGRSLVKDKNILELGAGTGFLSLLCAKHLGARHITSTDGDEGVVEALKENAFLNELHDASYFQSSVFRWGRGIVGSWVEEDFASWPYDLVIGADITYEKQAISALVATLRMLFQMKPDIQVLIAGAVRNWETFNTFTSACQSNNFRITDLQFPAKMMREQSSLFYATACPLKILRIEHQ